MVNKTNVLEIQLNGTQSCCKFFDVKGFGKFSALIVPCSYGLANEMVGNGRK